MRTKLAFLLPDNSQLSADVTPPFTREEEQLIYEKLREREDDGTAECLKVVLEDILRSMGRSVTFRFYKPADDIEYL